MSKEEILKIADSILNEGVVATHGTSIESAKSIMKTGLDVKRTTFIVYSKNREARYLATYGWKENEKGNAANVVITIPISFLQLLVGYSYEEAEAKIQEFRNEDIEEEIIRSIMDIKEDTIANAPEENKFHIPLLPKPLFNIPKEFIRGVFVYQNNTNYLSFFNNGTYDYEQALQNLIFWDNPNYFCNLSEEQQDEFIKIMREKIGLEKQKR